MGVPLAAAAAAKSGGSGVGKALLATGAQSGGGILGNWLANRQNQKLASQQQKWNVENAREQRLFDFNMWNMTNKYNSPIEQMARLSEAGLNPNLIYGNGSTATGQASPLKSPDVKGYSRAQAQSVTKGLDTFGQFNQFRSTDAQIDNVKAQTEVAKQDAKLKATEALIQAIGLKDKGLQYDISKQLKDTTIDGAKANLTKLQQDVQMGGLKLKTERATQPTQVKKIEQDFKNAVLAGDIKSLEKKLKSWEVELSKMGVTKSDNQILRWLMELGKKVPPGTMDLIWDLYIP
ncbi:DNA pilot protein [Microviridae sp.]|nr:DNA pilot protein [Microviridae sp.]